MFVLFSFHLALIAYRPQKENHYALLTYTAQLAVFDKLN